MANLTIDGTTYHVADGLRLTNAIEAQGIDILHRCGGNAKCTTCKVQFNSGEPSSMTAAEKEKLEDKGDLGEYRLSCQIACAGDMDVTGYMTMTSTGLDDPGPALSDDAPSA